MINAEKKSLSESSTENSFDPDIVASLAEKDFETVISQLLHDFKNQLGGVKLYAAFLKRSLEKGTLDVSEGVAVCEKIIQQIDELAARVKAVKRDIKPSTDQL